MSYPEPDDGDIQGATDYQPSEILQSLIAGLNSPLKFAPATTTERLVGFLTDRSELFSLYEHMAEGGTLRAFADSKRLSYFAMCSMYESDVNPFKAMRDIAARAVSREDRERVRSMMRSKQTNEDTGEEFERTSIHENEKRYVDAAIALAKSETPDQFVPNVRNNINVNLQQNFGAAIATAQRTARASANARLIENKPVEAPEDGSDLF